MVFINSRKKHNNIFGKKKIVAILFTCVLTSMQNFAAIDPFGPRSEGGGGGGVKLIPPVKICSQKAQLK